MYVTIPMEKWDNYFVLFGDKIKNKIIEKSDFCNLIYSTELGTFNNIIFTVTFKNVMIDTYFNKYKCMFSNANEEVVEQLLSIESQILNKYNRTKKKNYKLLQQLSTSSFKFLSMVQYKKQQMKEFSVCIKLSGIWENEEECGIIYKFVT